MLLPLAVAAGVGPIGLPRSAVVEAGVALGFIAFALILVQFALVSRIDRASRPFGADALAQFHRQMGILALALAAAHPVLLGSPAAAWMPFGARSPARSGAVALWATVVIVVTSVARRRLRLSYEVWQVIHLATSVLLAAAMLAHVTTAGAYARVPAVRWVVLIYAGAFVALAVRYRVVRPLVIWRRPWVVVFNRDEGARTRTIRVRPAGHAGFTFEPGQFAWLITGRTPLWSEQHPISMSSSAERSAAEGIEFSIKALGDWSAHVVPALGPGRRMWVDGPFGAFTPDRTPGRDLILIGGGIGIAPMRAMLQTLRDRGDRRHVVLFQTAHDETRLLFEEEMASLRDVLNLDVVQVLEEPSAAWTGERGLITRDLLERRLPRQYRSYLFFVCGPVPMMDAMEDVLTALGVPAASIHTERFDIV